MMALTEVVRPLKWIIMITSGCCGEQLWESSEANHTRVYLEIEVVCFVEVLRALLPHLLCHGMSSHLSRHENAIDRVIMGGPMWMVPLTMHLYFQDDSSHRCISKGWFIILTCSLPRPGWEEVQDKVRIQFCLFLV